MTVAAVGAATGLLMMFGKWIVTPLYAISPLLATPFTGISIFGVVLAADLIRRPGAGIGAGVIAALVSLPFGAFNPRTLITVLVVGAAVEGALALGHRRRYAWYMYLPAALLNGAVLSLVHWFAWQVFLMYPGMQISMIISLFAMQLLWAGAALLVARALRRAGAGEPVHPVESQAAASR